MESLVNSLVDLFSGLNKDVVVFIIIVVASVFMSSSNDAKLIESLEKQHKQTVKYDYGALLKSLDNNTTKFYESL